jgi:hypothetical protein
VCGEGEFCYRSDSYKVGCFGEEEVKNLVYRGFGFWKRSYTGERLLPAQTYKIGHFILRPRRFISNRRFRINKGSPDILKGFSAVDLRKGHLFQAVKIVVGAQAGCRLFR